MKTYNLKLSYNELSVLLACLKITDSLFESAKTIRNIKTVHELNYIIANITVLDSLIDKLSTLP